MKIKNMSKRFISVFLSLMMCVSLLQVPAFAAIDPVTGEEIPDNVIGDVVNTDVNDTDVDDTDVDDTDVDDTDVNDTDVDDTDVDDTDVDDTDVDDTDVDDTDVDDTDVDDTDVDDTDVDDTDQNKKPVTVTNPDGSTTTTAPDGTVTEKDPDGNFVSITTKGEDGSTRTEYADQSVVVVDADGNTTKTVPNGPTTVTTKEGVVTVTDIDGTKTTTDLEGTITVTDPEGNLVSTTTTGEDGTIIVTDAAGELISTTYTAEDGTIVTEYANGSMKAELPDGTVTVMDTDGNVTTTYPDGTVTNAPLGEEIETLDEESAELEKISFTKFQELIDKAVKDNTGILTLTKNYLIEKDEDKEVGLKIANGVKLVLDLAGCTITGILADSPGGNDSLITVNGNLTIQDSKGGGKITTKNTGRGVDVYKTTNDENDGIFTLEGGSISGNQVGNGKELDLKAQRDLVDSGKVTNYLKDFYIEDNENSGHNQGGGVRINKNAVFNLSGGSITNNVADEGGGIFVDGKDGDDSGSLIMTGGNVSNNEAFTGEGGGIYIKGTGDISCGVISNNKTHTFKDLGGGGIYVEGKGLLDLTNALITKNTANGLGGGVAACVHGATAVLGGDAAIFDNTAKGDRDGFVRSPSQTFRKNGAEVKDSKGTTWRDFIDSYHLWQHSLDKDRPMNAAFRKAAQDIFSAGDAQRSFGGALIGNSMTGGGSSDWSGYVLNYADGDETADIKGDIISIASWSDWPAKNPKDDIPHDYKWSEINESNNTLVSADKLLGLTSKASETDREKASNQVGEGEFGVYIWGNESLYTHGGGIATNGTLNMIKNGDNEAQEEVGSAPEFSVEKVLNGGKPAEGVDPGDGSFTFNAWSESTDDSGTVTKTPLGSTSISLDDLKGDTSQVTASSSLDFIFDKGKKTIQIGEKGEPLSGVEKVISKDKTSYTYTFFVQEKLDGNNVQYVTYDDTVYQVEVTIMATKETKHTPGTEKDTTTVTTYTFDGFKMNGETVTPDEGKIPLTFTNTYKEPDRVDDITITTPELTLEKFVKVVSGEVPTDGQFNFIVTDEAGTEVPAKVLLSELNPVTAGDSSLLKGSAKVSFDFLGNKTPSENDLKNGLVFYVYEVSSDENSIDNVTYSTQKYKVTIPVKKGYTIYGDKIHIPYEYQTPTIELVKENSFGDVIPDSEKKDSIIQFTNVYNETKRTTEEEDLPALTLTKVLETVRGQIPNGNTFQFEITDENGKPIKDDALTLIETDALIGSGTATQTVKYDFVNANKPEVGNTQTYSFFIREVNNNIANVKYSDQEYKVTVTLSASQRQEGNFDDPLSTHEIITAYTYSPLTIESVTRDAEGNIVSTAAAPDGLVFNNIFETPRSDRPSRTPDPTPETPPTPTIPDEEVPLGPAPEEPEVTVPDEEVPLAPQPEVPEVTLPEPEVPLAPMPPETTTIPEPEVPLAGVPQTGDGSGAWFALMALAACGLVVLNLRKKENEI